MLACCLVLVAVAHLWPDITTNDNINNTCQVPASSPHMGVLTWMYSHGCTHMDVLIWMTNLDVLT